VFCRDVKIDLDPKAKAKKRRLGQGKTPQAKRSRKSYLIDLPGPSSGVSVPVVRQQDNNVSSSQETCYSGDEDEVPQRVCRLCASISSLLVFIIHKPNSPN